MSNPEPQRAGLARRLAAIFYDTLLLFAVLFFATALALPFTHGQAVRPHNPWYSSYLLLVTFFFLAWFWVHGGQTLGMRAWGLRVQRRDGGPISWWQALLRFLVAMASWAVLGAGFWWMLVDREHMTWHDRYSETVIVRIRPARA